MPWPCDQWRVGTWWCAPVEWLGMWRGWGWSPALDNTSISAASTTTESHWQPQYFYSWKITGRLREGEDHKDPFKMTSICNSMVTIPMTYFWAFPAAWVLCLCISGPSPGSLLAWSAWPSPAGKKKKVTSLFLTYVVTTIWPIEVKGHVQCLYPTR